MRLRPLCTVDCTKQKTKLRLSAAVAVVAAAAAVAVVAIVVVVVVVKFVCIENAFGPSCNEPAKCSSK